MHQMDVFSVFPYRTVDEKRGLGLLANLLTDFFFVRE